MGDWDKPIKPQEIFDDALKKVQGDEISFLESSEMESWWFGEKQDKNEYYNCMLAGIDSTGKSGIAIDSLTHQDIKDGKKIIIIDLDGGCQPLINRYHKEKINNIIVQNPMTHPRAMKIENGDIKLDYKIVLALIKGTVNMIAAKHKEMKIKAVVFDGLSTFLKVCEDVMRMEKHLAPDGGVNQLFWKIRSKHFNETIMAMKSLPVNKFFIAHEDFIKVGDEKMSSVREKTNQEMHQRVHCIREDQGDKVIFKAIINKNKFKVGSEGKEIIFCTVDKATEKADWSTKKIYESLM